MGLLSKKQRTELLFLPGRQTVGVYSGSGNFQTGARNAAGNVPVSTTVQSGAGWAGADFNGAQNNIEVDYTLSAYESTGLNGAGNLVLVAV